MMTLNRLSRNSYFQITIQVIMTFVGFIFVAVQVNSQYFSTGGNIWNARFFGIFGVLIISTGFSLVGSDFRQRIYRFLVSVGILLVAWFIVGGVFVANDASSGTNYVNNNVWVGFDVMSDFEVVTFDLATIIAHTVVISLCIGTIAVGFLAYFNSDMVFDRTTAIIQVLIAGIVIIVYTLIFIY